MNDQELHNALEAISKSPVKRWIVETAINILLFVQWLFGDNTPGGGASA